MWERNNAYKRTAIGRLAEQGFFPVRQIQMEVGTSKDVSKSIIGTGDEVSTHWRRGHWRRQPHGKDRKSIKLVWIKPVLVRADKGAPTAGHVYNVQM